jgi:hypothetical protein
MSVGGVFQLISNNGIQDRLIMATDQLMENVRDISRKKIDQLRIMNPDKSDQEISAMDEAWMPTLRAIEKTHIMFVNNSFKPFVAMAHEYSRTPPRQGKAVLGGTFSFTLPIIGEFVNDMVMYVKLTGLSSVSALDKVRYVEFLGHRLTKQVKFKVQNHVLDSYTTDDQNAYYQYKVPLHKETGYLRNIGQEVPKTGYLTADPTVDEVRSYRQYGDGPQTFKQTQLDVEMWIPILFWFKDIQNSLPNFLLPMNQTDVEVTFEAENNLVAFANYGGGGNYNVPIVDTCYLYINHIFLLPEINRIFITRFGFQLIRVHLQHVQEVNTSEGSVHLHQLKWPIESLYVAFRPKANLASSGKWHRSAHIVDQQVREVVVTGVAVIQINNAVYYDEQHVVQSLGLRAHDVTIYPNLRPEFYNNYLPSQYGEHIKTPRDLGWYMFNFAHTPGEQQPSGHFNSSTARELYLDYVSAIDSVLNQPIIRDTNPCDLIVIADCLNFLLIHKNQAVLKFST